LRIKPFPTLEEKPHKTYALKEGKTDWLSSGSTVRTVECANRILVEKPLGKHKLG
jgi:hypothetical protein